jgi:hypothetical protein
MLRGFAAIFATLILIIVCQKFQLTSWRLRLF